MVIVFNIIKLHYSRMLWDGSDDGPAGSSQRVIDLQGVVDGIWGASATDRFAHMQGASVVASEGSGETLPTF